MSTVRLGYSHSDKFYFDKSGKKALLLHPGVDTTTTFKDQKNVAGALKRAMQKI